jgi:hypothetical protein
MRADFSGSGGCRFQHTRWPEFQRRLLFLAKLTYIKRQSCHEPASGEALMEKIGLEKKKP